MITQWTHQDAERNTAPKDVDVSKIETDNEDSHKVITTSKLLRLTFTNLIDRIKFLLGKITNVP